MGAYFVEHHLMQQVLLEGPVEDFQLIYEGVRLYCLLDLVEGLESAFMEAAEEEGGLQFEDTEDFLHQSYSQKEL